MVNNIGREKYFKSLFIKNTLKTSTEYDSFQEILDLPKLTHYNMMLCDDNLTKKEV